MDAIDQLRAISKLPDKEIVALTDLRMERETDLRSSNSRGIENLTNEIALVVRLNWVSAGWHPPDRR